MRFLVLINLFALLLVAKGLRGEKFFEESTEANLDFEELNHELMIESQNPKSTAQILSSVKDKSSQLLHNFTVEDLLKFNSVTLSDCKRSALKRRAGVCPKLDDDRISSTAKRNLIWYCEGTLVQLIKRCHEWRDEAKVKKYLSEVELEILHNQIKFGTDYQFPQLVAKLLKKKTQMTSPLKREKIFDESSGGILDDKSLMDLLSMKLKPVEVAKHLSEAKNKQLELLVGRTVQDYLNLNAITVLDCEKSNLIRRTKSVTDPAYFHHLSQLEKNLNAYARDIVLEIVERCYKKRDNPTVSSSWSRDELDTLHRFVQKKGPFAYHTVDKYLIPGRYKRRPIYKEYILVEKTSDDRH